MIAANVVVVVLVLIVVVVLLVARQYVMGVSQLVNDSTDDHYR